MLLLVGELEEGKRVGICLFQRKAVPAVPAHVTVRSVRGSASSLTWVYTAWKNQSPLFLAEARTKATLLGQSWRSSRETSTLLLRALVKAEEPSKHQPQRSVSTPLRLVKSQMKVKHSQQPRCCMWSVMAQLICLEVGWKVAFISASGKMGR